MLIVICITIFFLMITVEFNTSLKDLYSDYFVTLQFNN